MQALGERVFDARFFEDGSVSCEADSNLTPERIYTGPNNEHVIDFVVMIVAPSPNTLGENRESWEGALREGIFNIFPVGSFVRTQILCQEIPIIDMGIKEAAATKVG